MTHPDHTYDMGDAYGPSREEYEQRIAELEAEVRSLLADNNVSRSEVDERIAELEHERDQHAGTAQALERLNLEHRERIADLEAERQGWLDKLEARGPGLEAYREQGQRIAELEREVSYRVRSEENALNVSTRHETRIAELETKLTAARKAWDAYKNKHELRGPSHIDTGIAWHRLNAALATEKPNG